MSEKEQLGLASPSELVMKLAAISKSIRQLSGFGLTEIDVVPGQDQVLLVLLGGDRLTIGELADRLSVRASTASKMVNNLVARGWISRFRNCDDQRRVGLSLTDIGHAKAVAVREVQSRLNGEVTNAIDEPADALQTLAKLDDVLSKRLRRLR